MDQVKEVEHGFAVSGVQPSPGCLDAIKLVTCHNMLRKCRTGGVRLSACEDVCQLLDASCDGSNVVDERLLHHPQGMRVCGDSRHMAVRDAGRAGNPGALATV